MLKKSLVFVGLKEFTLSALAVASLWLMPHKRI